MTLALASLLWVPATSIWMLQLTLLDASMLTVNRLIMEAEMKKAKLFSAYHDSAFKAYGNVAQLRRAYAHCSLCRPGVACHRLQFFG